MQPLFDLLIMELKAVHDLPEMWTADRYRQLLQALEFDGIDEIETADLPEMAVMALQDLKPEEAAEDVLKFLVGDRLHAGIRQNLAQEMKERRLWEEYGEIFCHAGLFLAAVLLNRAFPKVYLQAEIGRLILTETAQNGPAAKLLAKEPSAGFVVCLLADGMNEHSILKRLYAPLPKLRPASKGLAAGLVIIVLASLLLIIPLGNTYLRVMRSTNTVTAVHQQIIDTLGPSSPVVVNHIDVNGKQVTIDLSDVNGAPSAAQFEADLVDELGPNVSVELR